MTKHHWSLLGRIVALLLGAALLFAAAALAWEHVDLAPLADAPPWIGGALGAAVAGNLLLTGALFWAITRRFDARPPVPLGKMIALICTSAMLNYLPMVRAGLVGRAAFLKVRHNLPIGQSVIILLIVLGLAGVILPAIAAVALLVDEPYRYPAMIAVITALAVAAPSIATRLLGRPADNAWLWVLLRSADLLVAAARLHLAFAIVGHPIEYHQAMAAAAASLAVKLVGLTPNGLGLSEWTVAALTPLLTPMESAVGAAAALVDRAVDALVVLVTGLASLNFLRR